ncbi:polyphosphate kinase 2 [Yimella sp. cx-573]|nr:polyphosphate kinase 2 [Yimella sp. cx-573]
MAKKTANGTVRMDKELYEKELERLQTQLVAMQEWVKETGARVVIVCEGRDAAGKGSAIKRITQYLNPRVARVAALPAPSDRQKTQWYFQRYVEHLPAAGEIVIFDRSWYNRAGVEHVMGFCTDEQYERFLIQAPIFEQMLIDDGIILRKYWFSVSDVEQEARFKSRHKDPMRQWKLSPMDLESITRWEAYSQAKDRMFSATDRRQSPWNVVESEDKRASRINVIADILESVPWERVEPHVPQVPERPAPVGYTRPPRTSQTYVADHASEVSKGAGSGSASGKSASKAAKGTTTKRTATKSAAKKSATKKS